MHYLSAARVCNGMGKHLHFRAGGDLTSIQEGQFSSFSYVLLDEREDGIQERGTFCMLQKMSILWMTL